MDGHRRFGGIMRVGDLVRYEGTDYLGIVVETCGIDGDYMMHLVWWADGECSEWYDNRALEIIKK